MYYVIQPTLSDLQHHGILGQKWGRRNGPPYPLDGSDHSALEKKAGWKNSLTNNENVKKLQNKDGSLTKKGKKRFSKLIKIDEEFDSANKKVSDAIDKESSYLKKSGYLKGSGENYKEALRELYFLDNNFKEIVDSRINLESASKKIGDKRIKEINNVANKKYGALTIIGYNRTEQVLNDYKKGRSK